MQQISTRYTYSLELLKQLIKQQSRQTTLIICWEHTEFFNQILSQLSQPQIRTLPPEIASSQHSDAGLNDEENESDRALVTPTLQLLSRSRSIKLIYCPTVPILRAYLASFSTIFSSNTATSSAPQLIILDLLALQQGTSEFTLQGLSQTFAAAVSAAYQTQSDLTLVECKDNNDPTDPHRGSRLWNAQVPLLSGSVKLGQDGTRWAGRSIIVLKIASRWFTIEQDQEQSDRAAAKTVVKQEDDEMLI